MHLKAFHGCFTLKNAKERKSMRNRQPVEVIRLERVGFDYPGSGPVFFDLNYVFYTAGFYFLTGPSGAGKTSLLKLLYRDIKTSHGTVRVFGRDVSTISSLELPEFRQRMGLVFQDCQLLDHLNVLDNVAVALKIGGMEEARARIYSEELLQWVGLADHLNAFPQFISDGQKQRVAIARAVITRPLLLLADEPTGNVDDFNARKLLNLFEELNKLGTTVILATHDRNLISQFSYPELHLSHGELNAFYPHASNSSPGQTAYS